MGVHDEYGKEILRKATRGAAELHGTSVEIDYGTAHPARIDATVREHIAIEIESRTGKQVRGAVLDLLCHPYPKKLLILQPIHMSNACAEQCRNILTRFLAEKDFQIIVLKGGGHNRHPKKDVKIVAEALRELETTR